METFSFVGFLFNMDRSVVSELQRREHFTEVPVMAGLVFLLNMEGWVECAQTSPVTREGFPFYVGCAAICGCAGEMVILT